MKKCGILLVGISVAVWGIGSVWAANHYVRQGATGNGSDWTNAYGQLPALLVRGDVYYIADGSYSGYTFNTPVSGTAVVTIKKATPGDHGTDTGWNSTYGDGTALFTGTVDFSSSYCVFDGQTGGGPGSWKTGLGFKVSQVAGSPAVTTGFTKFLANASTDPNIRYITIKHLEVVGNDGTNQGGGSIGNDAFAFYGGGDITIAYSYAHHMGRAIIFGGSNNTTFEYSYTGHFVSTASVHSEIASIWNTMGQAISNWTFRHCVFTHSEGTGGIMYEGDDLKIYGCVFAPLDGNSFGGGNGVIGTWSSSELTNVRIYNNTFINVGVAVVGVTGTAAAPIGEFRNNLLYKSLVSGGIGQLTRSHNHYVEAVLSWDGTTNDGGTQTMATGDPLVNFTGLDFHLKAPTATGFSLVSPYHADPLGITRGADGVWDRGAYEYVITDIRGPKTEDRKSGQYLKALWLNPLTTEIKNLKATGKNISIYDIQGKVTAIDNLKDNGVYFITTNNRLQKSVMVK